MLALLAATAYGMLDDGLYRDELWLPVAAGVLALLFVTLFVRGFYWDLPTVGILLVGLLATLVAIKGLSMVWTISETETIKETLRSSMYLAAFLMALAALTSGRQVGSLIDASVFMVAAVAGYGLLQKISPIEYPVRSLDGVRMDSTLGYANTTAVILGMGVVLALARMRTLRSFVLRGLYAAVTLSFFIALYLTVSRGGIGSLGHRTHRPLRHYERPHCGCSSTFSSSRYLAPGSGGRCRASPGYSGPASHVSRRSPTGHCSGTI